MSSRILFLILVSLVLYHAKADQATFNEITCKANEWEPVDNPGFWITCENLTTFNGRSFLEVLRRAKYDDRNRQRMYSFNDVAPTTTRIAASAIGNVMILDGDLEAFPMLTYLTLNQKPNQDLDVHLDIAPKSFKNQNLKEILFQRFTLTNNTIQAISEKKNRLNMYAIDTCQPEEQLLKLSETMENLNVLMIGCNDTRMSPLKKFDRLPKGLTRLEFYNCNLQKISSTMLRGQSNLTSLALINGSIAIIEENAFDDLINLRYLTLTNNGLTILPDGLFKENRELIFVDILGNKIENISRANFTNPRFSTLIT